MTTINDQIKNKYIKLAVEMAREADQHTGSDREWRRLAAWQYWRIANNVPVCKKMDIDDAIIDAIEMRGEPDE